MEVSILWVPEHRRYFLEEEKGEDKKSEEEEAREERGRRQR